MMKKHRLQVILARAGLGSRRSLEGLILEGRVTLNGRVVKELGTLADPDIDEILVDGKPLPSPPPPIYIILNKPRGVITTMYDPQGRPTVKDLLRDLDQRVFPVGRLDRDTEGILLLCNDGELAYRLTHPRFGIPRIYKVKVRGRPGRGTIETLSRGTLLDDGRPAKVEIRRIWRAGANTWLELVLREGRNREIRRLCEAIGHPVISLKRTGFAGLTLEGLKPGQFRFLTPNEIKVLKLLCQDNK